MIPQNVGEKIKCYVLISIEMVAKRKEKIDSNLTMARYHVYSRKIFASYDFIFN